MHRLFIQSILMLLLVFGSCSGKTDPDRKNKAEPPFSGTIFLDPDIITESDPSAFESLVPAGQGTRVMYDRRVSDWITVEAFLFSLTFDDGLTAEVQVNPEFGSMEIAGVEAEKYSRVIGCLPASLRKEVETVWIHKGDEPFGGGNNNLLIHTGQADKYVAEGILEETFVHEASHTSLDALHSAAPGWIAAQQKDPAFISTYARDNPAREDIAETFLLYLAVACREDRISSDLAEKIRTTIPHRLIYLGEQDWDLHPMN